MPNNRKTTKKAIKGKEGIHPGSRKGVSLVRTYLLLVAPKSGIGSDELAMSAELLFFADIAAGQITRAALRTVKLQQQNKHRKGDVHVKRTSSDPVHCAA